MAGMVDDALMSSRSEEWETPDELFQRLNAIFAFRLDACAAPNNAKCARFFTKDDDALRQDWAGFGRVWMNPPYGRGIGAWMKKAYLESRRGCLVVALVHARTDTRWWHDWVAGKASATFIKGRLTFKRGHERSTTAPFPSVIVVYAPDLDAVLNAAR